MDNKRLRQLAGVEQLNEQYDANKFNEATRYLAHVAIQDAKEALQDLSPQERARDLERTAIDYIGDSVAQITQYVQSELNNGK